MKDNLTGKHLLEACDQKLVDGVLAPDSSDGQGDHASRVFAA